MSPAQVRRGRMEHIRASTAEIGDQLRRLSGLASVMIRTTLYLALGACFVTTPIAYYYGRHRTADILVFTASGLFFVWVATRWLRHHIGKLLDELHAALKAERDADHRDHR